MERQCLANAQYSRRECLDTIGIPSEVEADVLEEKVVVNIFILSITYVDDFGKYFSDIDLSPTERFV